MNQRYLFDKYCAIKKRSYLSRMTKFLVILTSISQRCIVHHSVARATIIGLHNLVLLVSFPQRPFLFQFQLISALFARRLAVYGQTFDEIVVSSDLNVRRKSKESRQGKRLTNIPSATTGPPEKSTVVVSRLVSNDGSRITSEKTQIKREISDFRKRWATLLINFLSREDNWILFRID